jgi:hypothetical protein
MSVGSSDNEAHLPVGLAYLHLFDHHPDRGRIPAARPLQGRIRRPGVWQCSLYLRIEV